MMEGSSPREPTPSSLRISSIETNPSSQMRKIFTQNDFRRKRQQAGTHTLTFPFQPDRETALVNSRNFYSKLCLMNLVLIPGQRYAYLELKTTIAKVILNLRLEGVHEMKTIQMAPHLVLRPIHGVKIKISKRENPSILKLSTIDTL